MHYLKNFHRDDLSVTNYLQYKLFNLPSSPNMIFYENKITLIAEAGVNYNGSIKIAKKLVDIAKKQIHLLLNFKHLKQRTLLLLMLLKLNIKKQVQKTMRPNSKC